MSVDRHTCNRGSLDSRPTGALTKPCYERSGFGLHEDALYSIQEGGERDQLGRGNDGV